MHTHPAGGSRLQFQHELRRWHQSDQPHQLAVSCGDWLTPSPLSTPAAVPSRQIVLRHASTIGHDRNPTNLAQLRRDVLRRQLHDVGRQRRLQLHPTGERNAEVQVCRRKNKQKQVKGQPSTPGNTSGMDRLSKQRQEFWWGLCRGFACGRSCRHMHSRPGVYIDVAALGHAVHCSQTVIMTIPSSRRYRRAPNPL